MGLKKERICVWITQEKRDGQVVLAWLACPLARYKEFNNRLQSAYAKKVKGNRLKNLVLDEVTSATQAFCEEYITALFRIANLAGFGGVYWPKAPYLEQALFTQAAKWLKEQFPNCDFMVYYNPKSLRLSTLKSWLGKNQLQAELVIEPSSLPMATILFVSQLALQSSFEGENAASLQKLQDKVKREEAMATRWNFVSIQALYLGLVAKDEQKVAKKLFHQVPNLVEQGIFEKWLKKGWKAGDLAQVLDYLKKGLPQDIVLQTPLAKLPAKAQEYFAPPQEDLIEEPVLPPFPQQSMDSLFQHYMDWILSLPGLRNCEIVEERFWPLWKARFLAQIESFVAQKKEIRRKPVIYMAVEGNYVWMMMSSIMPCLVQLNDEQLKTLPFVTRQKTTVKNMFGALEKMSHLSPVPNVCASKEILGRLHSWSVQNNLFLPFHELSSSEQQVVCNEAIAQSIEPDPLELSYFTQSQGTPWFSQSIFEGLSQFQRDFLARYPFGIQETRLVAKAFEKGLSLDVAQEYVGRTEASILRLVRSYLYPTRIQNFLKHIDYLDELRLLTRSSLRLSQMEELLALCTAGYPALWLQANLKGNPTLAYLQKLKAHFPFGHVPAQWQKCYLASDEVLTWMFDVTSLKHPDLDSAQLVHRLLEWNCNLLDALLSHPFSEETA